MMNTMYRRRRRIGIIESIRKQWRRDMTFYHFWLRMGWSRAQALDYADRALQ
jgi:hypothetical protein